MAQMHGGPCAARSSPSISFGQAQPLLSAISGLNRMPVDQIHPGSPAKSEGAREMSEVRMLSIQCPHGIQLRTDPPIGTNPFAS